MREKLQAIESLIVKGRTRDAQDALRKLRRAAIPARERLRYAELCRRSDLASLGVRILYPVVRRDPARHSGTSEEKTEYAACLIRLGAVDEARLILSPLLAQFPKAKVFLAFAHITRWEYQQAVPLLESFIKSWDGDTYLSTIAAYNLAASLTAVEKIDSSSQQLKPLIKNAKDSGNNFLLAACLELEAQNQVLSHDWNEAKRFLEKARSLLASTEAREAFFIRKWGVFTDWLSESGGAKALQKLKALREEARKRKHWETLRQSDYYEYLVTHDSLLLGKLLCGTAYPSFRERVRVAAEGRPVPDFFHWPVQGARVTIDVNQGTVIQAEKRLLKPEQLGHRLLKVLASDFYRPFRVPTLHSAVYPGEFYSPYSSPMRVHFAIQALRSSFSRQTINCQIVEESGEYRLKVGPETALLVMNPEVKSGDPQWVRIQEKFGQRPFTALDVATLLEVSRRSALRVVEAARQQGLCLKRGKGPATEYVATPSALPSERAA